MDYNSKTRLYNVLMGNPSANNAIGRTAGLSAGQQQGGGDNFFVKRGKSIENAVGTTGAALKESGFDLLGADIATLTGGDYVSNESRKQNEKTEALRQDNRSKMNEIAKEYGFNTYQDVWDARDKAKASGDKNTLDLIDNTINPRLQAQANAGNEAMKANADEYKDYRENNYVSQKINQDPGKFAGSAINTMSTALDVAGLTTNPLANAVQGGVEGLADELEQNGFENFDLNRAGQNALIGATTGAVTGALNKGVSSSLAKRAAAKGLANTTEAGLGQTIKQGAKTIAGGAARGALSGAVGGATGAGLSAALNNQDVLGSALQGAVQGAQQGAVTGGIMAGVNMAPGIKQMNQKFSEAQQNWKNSGDTFGERWANTRAEDTWGNRLINGTEALSGKVADLVKERGVGLSIKDVSGETPAQDAYAQGKGSFSDALNEFIEQGGNIVRDQNGNLQLVKGGEYSDDISKMNVNRNDMLNYTDDGSEPITVEEALGGTAQRQLTAQAAPQAASAWDRVAQESGYNNYDEVVQRYMEANPNVELNPNNAADQILTWLDQNPNTRSGISGMAQEAPETELYRKLNGGGAQEAEIRETAEVDPKQRLKNIKAEALRDRTAEDLLNQVGTAKSAAAKADHMIDNVKQFIDEGLTKPEEWKLASDAVTGANGVMSKLHRNLISQAGDIDTFSGKGGRYGVNLEDTVDYYIKAEGLTDSAAKGVKNEIMSIIESLPSRIDGTLKMSDEAGDVMGAIRELEAHRRNYMGDDSRNLSTTDPYKTQKARAIKDVTSMLEERIYEKVPDATKVVTPEAIQELKNYFPDNAKWAKSVDEKFANIKTGKDLRAAQKRYVQTSDYLENVRQNYGTYGQKVGDVYGNMLSKGLQKVPLVGGILAEAANTPFMNRRYADINSARADKLEGRPIDLPSSKTVKNTGAPANTVLAQQNVTPTAQGQTATTPDVTMAARQNMASVTQPADNAPTVDTTSAPTASTAQTATTYNPATQIYNAIGRTEGLSNGEQARTANYLVDAVQGQNAASSGLSNPTVPNTNANMALYNSIYGTPTTTTQAVNSGIDTGYFQPTGDYWTDILAGATSSAIDMNDMAAFGSLYSMYQDSLANVQKQASSTSSNQQKLSATQQRANAAMNSLERLSQMTPDMAYNLSGIPLVGGIATFGGNDYEAEAKSLAQQIGYMVSGSNIKDSEAENIGKSYVPQPWDNEQVRQNKLRRAREIIQQYQSGYIEA